MALSAEQVAQVAYQAGFRGDDLVKIVAIAKRESGYDPAAHRSDRPKSDLSGDLGLWQINYTNWGKVSSALGLTDKRQLFDPVTNARAAFVLYQQSGLFPWSMAPGGWNANGNPLFGTNVEAARVAVNNAQQQGLIGQDFAGAGSIMANAGATPSGASMTAARFDLPSDAKIVNIAGSFEVYAVFDVGGVTLAYDVVNSGANWKNLPLHKMTRNEWENSGAVMAGQGNELVTVASSFGNFRSFWDSILDQVISQANPARNDPEVLRVIAEFAARPDMSPVELQNKLQGTSWWRTRTTAELEWNGLADGEKDRRRADTVNRMADVWFQYLGVSVGADDPRIQNYLEDVASGKMGFGAFTEVVKRQAAASPESPWSRQMREEDEAQRQRPIDLENTAQRIRDTLNRWGLQWTPTNIQDWARQIVEKRKSDEDLMNTVKQQAVTLFPWKDPEMETMEAAQPWLATYGRVMEKEANLFTPKIQAALTAGKPAWEFEQELKRSDEWLTTRNARQDMYGLLSEAGRRLGYV